MNSSYINVYGLVRTSPRTNSVPGLRDDVEDALMNVQVCTCSPWTNIVSNLLHGIGGDDLINVGACSWF